MLGTIMNDEGARVTILSSGFLGIRIPWGAISLRPSLRVVKGYVLSLFLVALISPPCWACPFCTVTSQTLSEEMEAMDAVVIARLTRLPETATAHTLSEEVPQGVFEIGDVLKSTAGPNVGEEIRTVIFGQEQVGDQFLIMGVGSPDFDWSTPMKVSPRAADYLRLLGGLPEKGPERLAFFQDYLEDAESLLARDAYDEFARSPYSDVKGLGDKMDHGRLVTWIQDPETALNRKRLYLVMLSACGGAEDLPMLEQLLRTEDRKVRAGLDATLGCYLLLAGVDGMTLVEDLFLNNAQAEYADTYAVPRERLLQGLHCLLDRPELADLIIPDLVRWEDWSQVERLVKLFKEADKKSNWVRVPIIHFLRVCPQPEAEQHLKELAKLDPDAIKRAETFFPFGGGDGSPEADLAAAEIPAQSTTESVASAPPSTPGIQAEPAAVAAARADNASASAGKLPILHRTASKHLNSLAYLAVLWIVGGVLFVVQWAILAGVGRKV
jgi:hypothetical protein